MNSEQQQRYTALETEKQALNLSNPDDRFRLTVIEQEQTKIKDQIDANDRLQRQATEVAEIELPEDYDLRFGFVGANGEIRSLISQVKEFLFSQHNDELAKLQADHKERITFFEISEAALIDQVAALEAKHEETEGKLIRTVNEKFTAKEQLIEAESKRDNAVAAKEEAEADRDKALNETKSLKSQVDELEGMLRTYRSRENKSATGGLVLTSTLKPVSEEERKANAERERIEQINRGLARIGQDPLPLPTSPAQAEAVAAAEEPDEDRFPADEDAHDAIGVDEADEAVEVAREADELTLDGLNERLQYLETWKVSVEERISGLVFSR